MATQASSHHRPIRARRRTGNTVRGIAAAVLLLLLVLGIPWGLWTYVGWPLPDHMPSWDEIQAVLLTPLSTRMLLDVLACLLWLVWALFTFDAALTGIDLVGRLPTPRPRHVGPLHPLAAALVGAVALTLLGQRPSASSLTAWQAAAQHPTATAPVTPTAALSSASHSPRPIATTSTATVRPPQHGIYDSLWRIADRELGDGSRWPEIFALNKGHPQPDGRSLHDPNLIRPGWTLRLPAKQGAPHPPPDRNPQPWRPLPPTPPSTADSPTPTPPGPPSDRAPHDHGVELPSGAFIGMGLAAAITATLLSVRLRRRIRYRPGSGVRDDLTVAPVVHALRIAHEREAPTEEASTPDPASPAELHVRNRAVRDAQRTADRIGIRDGAPVALGLAGTRGLGLTGPGARGATRALLTTLLANPGPARERRATVVIPTDDAEQLFGEEPQRRPTRLRLTQDINEALSVLEAELLTRTRQALEEPNHYLAPLILVATPAEYSERRLQTILDNGSALGLYGILLGSWPPGGTVRVRVDGTVAATSPHLRSDLADSRLFTLPVADTRDLLALLADGDQLERHAYVDRSSESMTAPATTEIIEQVSPLATSDALDAAQAHPSGVEQRLELRILGQVRILHRAGTKTHDLSRVIAAAKQREILCYLALHPDGARRQAMSATLWPDAHPDRPYNRLHATVSQLRRALRDSAGGDLSPVLTRVDDRYSLMTDRTIVDLWQLHDVLQASRDHTDDTAWERAIQQLTQLYRGELAEGLPAEWLVAPRQALHREVLDAVSTRAHAIRTRDPERALELWEQARDLDPHNEALYRNIAQAQAELGQYEAIARTLSLLVLTLEELDAEPTVETRRFFERLRRAPEEEHRPHGPA